jgi:ribosome biogenesis GTPase A
VSVCYRSRPMSIQWYPGHMVKARRVLEESMRTQDVIIEVLDARMPSASANPVLTEMRGQKPCIKVLSKSDLADPHVTKAWIRHFESAHAAGGRVLAVALAASAGGETREKIAMLSRTLLVNRPASEKKIRAMIVGVPNVGKSTLINTLMERKVAKVGDEPAVTKSPQVVILKSGMMLSDHPGLLWPNLDDGDASSRLAVGGAIPDVVIDYEVVAMFAANYFLERYPGLVKARYKLSELPTTPSALLAEIGRRRGCLRSGGTVDMHKAGDVLVHEFRTGKLGRISLEGPPPAAPELDEPLDEA